MKIVKSKQTINPFGGILFYRHEHKTFSLASFEALRSYFIIQVVSFVIYFPVFDAW